MARVTLGGGISSINGSIGGSTFQSGNSGTIIKNKGIPTVRHSSQANQSKSIIAHINQMWSDLNTTAKSEWQNFSIYKPTAQKNNPSRFLNGHQCFLLYNYAYFANQGGIIANPTFSTENASFRTFTIHNDTSNLFVRSTTSIDEGDTFLMFKISSQVKNGRVSSVGGVKQIICSFSGTAEFDITAPYQALFGSIPPVGSYVECEFQLFRSDFVNWNNKYRQRLEVLAY